jgi:hypothetical protein
MECVKLVVEAIDTVHWECRKKVRFVPLCGAALDQPVKGSFGPKTTTKADLILLQPLSGAADAPLARPSFFTSPL